MNKKILITISYLIFCNLSFAVFEDIGVTVRGKIAGEGYVSLCNDVGAIYYNPSVLGTIKNKELYIFYNNIYNLGLLDYTLVGYIHPKIGRGAIGLGWIRLGTTNNVDFMKYSENMFIFSYGQKIIENFYLGGNIKYYFVDYDYKASGLGTDISCMYTPIYWLKLGFIWQNFFSSEIFWQTGTKENINPVLKLGIAAEYKNQTFLFGLRYEKDIEPTLAWEYKISKIFSILLGTRITTKENSSVSIGFCVATKKIKFNYGIEHNRMLGFTSFVDASLKI